MGTVTFLALLLGTRLYTVEARTHSYTYLYTVSSGVPNFPEFVAVGMVDDVEMFRYDSETQRAEPKQDWMKNVIADYPGYMNRSVRILISDLQMLKDNIDRAKKLLNRTGDGHIYQTMYGCTLNDENKDVKTFDHDGFDGEDFITFDAGTGVFITSRSEVVPFKRRWDSKVDYIKEQKNYLTKECPEWLKKHLNHGKSSLLKTELPSVFLLQKTPSSRVTCHATGFYPAEAKLFWKKDGAEEKVHGEPIRPNHDGTFQMSAHLNPPASEDWENYTCVFQLPGAQDIVTRLLDEAVIRSSQKNRVHVYIIAPLAVIICCALLITFKCYQKKDKRSPSPTNATGLMENPNLP